MLGNRPQKKRQKGFATIYLTLVGAFLLIPMAGLAIDFGIVYNVKARLQTACDAGAIGAGYLLHATTNRPIPLSTQLSLRRRSSFSMPTSPATTWGRRWGVTT